MSGDLSETRRRAWKTRRAKYGERGHGGKYRRPNSTRCADMQAMLVRLYVEGTLSEGQAAKATGLDRVELRRLADDTAPPAWPELDHTTADVRVCRE